MLRQLLASWLLVVLTAGSARAQEQTPPGNPAPAQTPPAARIDTSKLPELCVAGKTSSEPNAVVYEGDVTCQLPDGARVYGDVIRFIQETDGARIEGEGNVVFSGPEGHISAERMEYHTATGTGVFEIAHGALALGPNVDRRQFGGQTPEVEFYGTRLEKIGHRRFRVTNGGWTTCLQPTPRWDFTTSSMVLELDHYVTARNTVLRVKGVPLFWLPFLYYPIQKDDRATGFLMPTYGTSTFRGPTLSNAFFWAIDRSQDATFLYDWFSRAGQGAGTEYRYVASPQSSGTVRFYRLNRAQTTFTEDGTTSILEASTSYEVNASAVQMVAPGIIARARVNYFTDIVSQQLLHQTLSEASNRNRLIEGGLTLNRGPWAGNAFFQRNEVINPPRDPSQAGASDGDTVVYGSAPRVVATLAPQRLFASPAYVSLNSDVAYLPYRHLVEGALVQDNSFGRLDASPSIRIPFSRLSFLSINTSAAYRATYYTRHASETAGELEDGAFFRQYATLRTEVVGPVFNRIFDVKDSGFAERIKHVIEPAVSVDVTSPIQDFRKTPALLDTSDFIVGGTSRITYGITNRLFFRKPTINKIRGETREFVTVGLQQTAYTNAEASLYDTAYSSAMSNGVGRSLSPIALTGRVSPNATFDGNMRAEYDVSEGLGLQSLTTGASVNYRAGGVTLNYSRHRFDRTQPTSSFVSASTRMQMLQDRVSGTYSLSWDVAQGKVVSQGVVGSYMAQCCGVQAEFQTFNYGSGLGLPLSTDRRINVAFVLAGIGTFSNFFGAFVGR